MNALEADLLRAHAADDRTALVGLYRAAALAQSDRDAACFFLTQAYVYALDTADPAADDLHARLAADGRV